MASLYEQALTDDDAVTVNVNQRPHRFIRAGGGGECEWCGKDVSGDVVIVAESDEVFCGPVCFGNDTFHCWSTPAERGIPAASTSG